MTYGAQYGDGVSLKAELTSADLTSIRESALGAADPLGIAAELAEAADAGRLADKNDAGPALMLAAEIAESRSKLDAALRYATRAASVLPDNSGASSADAVKINAVRARILFRAGRADEGMAAVEPLRPSLTEYPDAAAYVSAALAAGGKLKVAEEWLTEALQSALSSRGEPTEPDGVLFFLLQQRHRVRHALGLPHDHHDNLAEKLETRLANATAQAAEAPLLFFPKGEFDGLLAKWPALTSAFGADWDEHRARLERELVRLAGTGRVGLTLLPGTLAGLTAFAGGDGDATDPKTRAGYAERIANGTGQIPWPPERNGACWCGSGLKYKKCCLPRSR